MDVHEQTRQQRNKVCDIYNSLGSMIEEAIRPSERKVLEDARQIASELAEKLFQAIIVTNPRG